MTRLLLSHIAILFSQTLLFGQTQVSREKYHTESNGGLCGESIVIFKNNSYYQLRACEGSTVFSFGKCVQSNNKVKFYPVNNKLFHVIRKVETAKTNDDQLTVTVFDSNGINITSRILIVEYTRDKYTYFLELDSSKTKRTGIKRDSSLIILYSLQKLFDQKLEIPSESLNNFKFTINMSREWNFYSSSIWGGSTFFTLNKQKGKLISSIPDQVGDSEFRKSEYTKY